MIDHISAFQLKVRPNVLNRQPIHQQRSGCGSSPTSVQPTTVPLQSIIPFSAAVAVMWSNVAVVHAEVINVFQPTFDQDTVQSSSFGAVYLLGAVIPYFVLNAFIAPKLGLSKEVTEDDQDSMTPPENKTPF